MPVEVSGQVVVRPQSRVERAGKCAEDAVFVDIFCLAHLTPNRGQQSFQGALPSCLAELGVEHRRELLDQESDKFRMYGQHIFHVVLRKRDAELLQVFGVTSQQRGLTPVEIGAQDQAVEPVALSIPGEDVHEALFKTCRSRLDVDVGATLMAQLEVLYPERLAGLQFEFIGVLGIDVEPHFLEDGHCFG